MKKKTLLTQFWVLIYTCKNLIFKKKTETLWTQFWVIIYITIEFNSSEKNNHLISSILDNNLHN